MKTIFIFLIIISLSLANCNDNKVADDKIKQMKDSIDLLNDSISKLTLEIKTLKTTPENLIAEAETQMNNNENALALKIFEDFMQKYPTNSNKNYVLKNIEVLKKKIKEDELMKEYSFTDSELYSEFKNNRVAFDKKYDEKKIQVTGKIHDIKESWGCYHITLQPYDDEFLKTITFANCGAATPESQKKKWNEQLEKVNVGDEVTIRGIYSKILSDNYDISLYNCFIVK